jgi:hypothetical protein
MAVESSKEWRVSLLFRYLLGLELILNTTNDERGSWFDYHIKYIGLDETEWQIKINFIDFTPCPENSTKLQKHMNLI